MSVNRENVTWENEDGSWSRGFYRAIITGPDYEWDVEYGADFEWLTEGCTSEEDAWQAWDGANPGGTYVLDQAGAKADPGTAREIERCQAKAAAFKAAGGRVTPRGNRRW